MRHMLSLLLLLALCSAGWAEEGCDDNATEGFPIGVCLPDEDNETDSDLANILTPPPSGTPHPKEK